MFAAACRVQSAELQSSAEYNTRSYSNVLEWCWRLCRLERLGGLVNNERLHRCWSNSNMIKGMWYAGKTAALLNANILSPSVAALIHTL